MRVVHDLTLEDFSRLVNAAPETVAAYCANLKAAAGSDWSTTAW